MTLCGHVQLKNWGKMFSRNCCHSGPLLGNSMLQASSRMVMPRLNMSAAFVNFDLINSGAMYLESPSHA